MTSSKRRSKPDLFDEGVRHVENVLAIGLLVAIVVDVSLQIIFRYVLSYPLSWSSELSTYMFAWLTLIGMAVAQREHAHIEVRFFSHLSPAMFAATVWFACVASLLFFIVLLVGGYVFFSGETIQSGPASGIPLWAVYSSLPVGAALGLYHVLRDLPRIIRSPHSARPDLDGGPGIHG